jgi:SAM-dependent methyltransferase
MEADEHRKLAELEDGLWHFTALHNHVGRVLKARGFRPGARLLDAGCGTGGLLRRLHAWFPDAQLCGLDSSETAVAWARIRCACPIEAGSVTAILHPDGVFDFITCLDVVYQLERPAEAYREAARCLRAGGALVVNEPAYRWLWSYHDERVGGRHRFVRAEVLAMLRKAGLEPVFSTYWNCLPFPLIAARRKLLPPPAAASDVHDYPAWVARPMRWAMAVEAAWLRAGGRWPFGTSVFAVGVKNRGQDRSPAI